MQTNKHQVNHTIIEADLQAEIIKVQIDSYTMQPQFLISIPAINFEYYTFEANMVFWGQCKNFTELEKEIIKAGQERAAQLRQYYNNEIGIMQLDKINPLKKYNFTA